MLASIHASPNQLRWWLVSALNGFEDLEAATAIEHARSEIAAALRYLDALDAAEDAVVTFGATLKARIDGKPFPGKS